MEREKGRAGPRVCLMGPLKEEEERGRVVRRAGVGVVVASDLVWRTGMLEPMVVMPGFLYAVLIPDKLWIFPLLLVNSIFEAEIPPLPCPYRHFFPSLGQI